MLEESALFSKYQIPGFLKVFGFKFQVFASFFVPNSRYFHKKFSYKNLEMCRNRYRVPTSLVTQNSIYFPGYFQIKVMKSKVNLDRISVCADNVDIRIIFVNDILESEA